MKANQLYIYTKRDLAKARNQEKRKKNNTFLIFVLIVLFIISFLNSILWSVTFVYFIVAMILWDKMPWVKIIKSEDISDTEIQYELNTRLIKKEEAIRLLNKQVSDLYDNLPPDKAIEGRMEILPLDQKILSLYQEIFEINDTLEIENNPTHLKDVDKVQEEIVFIGEFLEQAKRKS